MKKLNIAANSITVNSTDKNAATKVGAWLKPFKDGSKVSILRGNYKYSDSLTKEDGGYSYGRLFGTAQEIVLQIFKVGSGSDIFKFSI